MTPKRLGNDHSEEPVIFKAGQLQEKTKPAAEVRVTFVPITILFFLPEHDLPHSAWPTPTRPSDLSIHVPVLMAPHVVPHSHLTQDPL